MKKIFDNKGFSLIELLIAMLLLGLVMTAAVSLFTASSENFTAQNMVVTMQGNTRGAMDFVTRTMKGLKTITTLTGEGTAASSIIFTTDETAFGGELCSHRFSLYTSASDGAGTLGYATGCPAITGTIQPLVPNITGFNVQRVGTARIDITISAETPTPRPDTRTKGTFTVRSAVDLRN